MPSCLGLGWLVSHRSLMPLVILAILVCQEAPGYHSPVAGPYLPISWSAISSRFFPM